jgi:hypothetical protein
MNTDPEILYINATIQGQTPLVYWAYAHQEGVLSVTAARERARCLLRAVAVAEHEAAIVRGIKAVPDANSKGFGRKPQKNKEAEAEEVALMTLALIRHYRPPFPEAIEIIFGRHTQCPLITISGDWYGGAMQLETSDAEKHAMDLLGAAEAAESDAFLYYFQAEIGLEQAEANRLVQEFGLFRQRNLLEDLFGGVG